MSVRGGRRINVRGGGRVYASVCVCGGGGGEKEKHYKDSVIMIIAVVTNLC